jgi:hypothetical protein
MLYYCRGQNLHSEECILCIITCIFIDTMHMIAYFHMHIQLGILVYTYMSLYIHITHVYIQKSTDNSMNNCI